MGLGRLNPGCQCPVCIPEPPDSPCRKAARHYLPISLTLNCTNYGGVANSTCRQDLLWPSCGAMPGNASSVQTLFDSPNAVSEETVCSAIATSRTNAPAGSECLTQSCCYGMWPIYLASGGSDIVGFCNNLSNSIGYPFIAQATASVGYETSTMRYFIDASVRIDALMYRLNAESVLGAWRGTPAVGANWFLESQFSSSPFFTTKVFRETGGPSIRTSRFTVLAQFGVSSDPRWCTWPFSGGYRYVMQAISGYRIYDDDPIWRTKRTFEIWIPDPALDGMGVTLGATATLNTTWV